MRHNSEYDRGYAAALSKVKHLEDKYALMWAEANKWDIPSKLSVPLRTETPERMFISGTWAVLEQLRSDGLIPEALIDKHWARLTGSPQTKEKGNRHDCISLGAGKLHHNRTA